MKHIAIISPCILPVPATKGGAVESLLTFIIEENEKVEGVKFDLFSISDDKEVSVTYLNTSIYTVKKGTIVKTADRILDKVYRLLPGEISAKRLFDDCIIAKVKSAALNNGHDYDAIVVENMMSLAVKLIESGIFGNSPLFFHIHNDIDIYRSPRFCRQLADRKVTFLCVSEYIKNRVLSYAHKADARVLYNGTDTNIFDVSLKSKNRETRNKYGLMADEVVFLYSGRIIPQKGVLELIDGYNLFRERNSASKTKLLIVGFSDIPTKYEDKILEKCRNIGDNILCHKKVEAKKMAEIVAAADVVTIPTMDEEPFGMVAIEAMAMGKPVIATRSGALTELLTVDNAVFVEKSADVSEALAKAFGIMMDGQLRKEMGSVSENLFKNNKEWHKDSFYKNFCASLGVFDEREKL